MSRSFLDADNDDIRTDTVPAGLDDNVMTMAAWWKPPVTTNNDCILCVVDSGSTNRWYSLLSVSDGTLDFNYRSGGVVTAGTTDTFNANEWNHACGVSISRTSRTVYLNGVAGENKGNNVNIVVLGRIGIGRLVDGSPSGAMEGLIAECAFWDLALPAGEVAALANGISPELIRPDNLVWYKNLIRDIQQPVRDGDGLMVDTNGTDPGDDHLLEEP